MCWNSNPGEVVNGSIEAAFELLKDHIRNVHIKELYSYPARELFARLRSIRYDRYVLCESDESCEPERYLSLYKALFDEMTRA